MIKLNMVLLLNSVTCINLKDVCFYMNTGNIKCSSVILLQPRPKTKLCTKTHLNPLEDLSYLMSESASEIIRDHKHLISYHYKVENASTN